MTWRDWKAEAVRLFGPDERQWRFVCPVCQHEQTLADFEAADAPRSAVGFSCIGRWLPKAETREAFGGMGKGPCSYAGGGLFRLNPISVHMPNGDDIQAFAFAVSHQPAQTPQEQP